MKFDDYSLCAELKSSLEEKHYKKPTDIQFKCIPHILQGEDVMAIAQTGTGKTAAFAIPLIQQIYSYKLKNKNRGIFALIMVPTRELAMQIADEVNSLAKYTTVKAYSLFGGVSQDPQKAKLQLGVDILVSTPGRMFDLISQQMLDLEEVKYLVLDEADRMLDPKFIKDIRDVQKYIPNKRQTLFFSATIDNAIKKLAYSLVKNAIRIQISPKDPVNKNIDHAIAYVEMDDKRFFLERFINEHEEQKILVFVRTKVRAERVKSAMERVQITCETLHGDIEQSERIKTLDRFRFGEIKVLVATDVSARGIDIAGVEYVINYDLPDKAENYVHRIGRTGRGNNRGYALSFCAKEERPILKEIEEYLGFEVEKEKITKSDYAETLQLKLDGKNDWQSLIDENEKIQEELAIKRKKAKAKKINKSK